MQPEASVSSHDLVVRVLPDEVTSLTYMLICTLETSLVVESIVRIVMSKGEHTIVTYMTNTGGSFCIVGTRAESPSKGIKIRINLIK